jgi:hypothetical protein
VSGTISNCSTLILSLKALGDGHPIRVNRSELDVWSKCVMGLGTTEFRVERLLLRPAERDISLIASEL